MKQESKHLIAKENSRKICISSQRETVKQESKHSIVKGNSRKNCTPSWKETMKLWIETFNRKGKFSFFIAKGGLEIKNTTTPLWKEALK